MLIFNFFFNKVSAGNNVLNKLDTLGGTVEFVSFDPDGTGPLQGDFDLPAVGATDTNTQVIIDGNTYSYTLEGYGGWPIDSKVPVELQGLTAVKIVLSGPGPLNGEKIVFTVEENSGSAGAGVDWATVYDGVGNGNITLDGAGDPNQPPPPPLCFVAGTLIQTAEGEKSVENLQVGDLVVTKDNGLQPIRWIGSRHVSALGKFAPIVFKRGAIGNTTDLMLSPQHRLLVSDWTVSMFFHQDEALVKAKDMVNGATIFQKTGDQVHYFHILLDDHALVYANGVAAETMLVGAEAIKSLDEDALEEVMALFPEKFVGGVLSDVPCRTILKSAEGRLVAANQ